MTVYNMMQLCVSYTGHAEKITNDVQFDSHARKQRGSVLDAGHSCGTELQMCEFVFGAKV